MIGGLSPLPQTFESKILDIIGEAGGSQLAFVPPVVLGHHDEGDPEILKDSGGINVGSSDPF